MSCCCRCRMLLRLLLSVGVGDVGAAAAAVARDAARIDASRRHGCCWCCWCYEFCDTCPSLCWLGAGGVDSRANRESGWMIYVRVARRRCRKDFNINNAVSQSSNILQSKPNPMCSCCAAVFAPFTRPLPNQQFLL